MFLRCIYIYYFYSFANFKTKNDGDDQQQIVTDCGCSEATIEVAGMEKRQQKHVAVLKSPFLTEFGSSEK